MHFLLVDKSEEDGGEYNSQQKGGTFKCHISHTYTALSFAGISVRIQMAVCIGCILLCLKTIIVRQYYEHNYVSLLDNIIPVR